MGKKSKKRDADFDNRFSRYKSADAFFDNELEIAEKFYGGGSLGFVVGYPVADHGFRSIRARAIFKTETEARAYLTSIDIARKGTRSFVEWRVL